MTDAVHAHFGKYRIDGGLYRGTVSDDRSSDPGDRLHTAACIHGNVDMPLTRNLKDFQAAAFAQAGVQVMTSDTLLRGLLSRRRQATIDSFTRAANVRKNPPLSAVDFTDALANAGAPGFAALLKRRLPK